MSEYRTATKATIERDNARYLPRVVWTCDQCGVREGHEHLTTCPSRLVGLFTSDSVRSTFGDGWRAVPNSEHHNGASSSLRPIGPRVLVRPVYPDADPSAIVLANPDDPTVADVIAVGEPRCKACGGRQTLSVAPGMRVTLRPEALFHEVTVGGETLWLVPIDDVVAEVLPEVE